MLNQTRTFSLKQHSQKSNNLCNMDKFRKYQIKNRVKKSPQRQRKNMNIMKLLVKLMRLLTAIKSRDQKKRMTRLRWNSFRSIQSKSKIISSRKGFLKSLRISDCQRLRLTPRRRNQRSKYKKIKRIPLPRKSKKLNSASVKSSKHRYLRTRRNQRKTLG